MRWSNEKIITMISMYHSLDTRTVTIRGKETVKPISVLDYNQCMSKVILKVRLLQFHMTERKYMNKWHMKLFLRLLNASILNAMIICGSNRGKRIGQLLFRIQLADGLCI
jgi:hypothetical protein